MRPGNSSTPLQTELIEKGKHDKHIDGQIDIHQKKQGPGLVFVRQKVYDSETQLQQVATELRTMEQNPYVNLASVMRFETRSERQICSTHYIAREYISYFPKTLSDAILTRSQAKTAFTREDLVNLLYQSLSGLAFLHSLGIVHQNISAACVRQSDGGFCLLYDPMNEKSGLFNPNYGSPDRMRLGSNFDKGKDDVYCLGLTLLETAILDKVSSATVDQGLSRLQQIMPDNQLFYSTVRQMLNPDSESRLDSLTLITGLPIFETIKSYFSQTGSNPAYQYAEVPRFWMQTINTSERASYLAPMKQLDGPSTFSSRVSTSKPYSKPQDSSDLPKPQFSGNYQLPTPTYIPQQQQHEFNVQEPPIQQFTPLVPNMKPSPSEPEYAIVSPQTMIGDAEPKMIPHDFNSQGNFFDFHNQNAREIPVRESIELNALRLDDELAGDGERKTHMMPMDKSPVRKSVDQPHTSMMRKTARSSALAFAPNIQKLPEEVVRAENLRSIPEGQTKMIKIESVKNLDRNNVLSLLQEIADGPTDFDSEVEKYSEAVKGYDNFFVTPQGQVFKKEETIYKTFDPVEGEKVVMKIQYVPDNSQSKQLNRYRFEHKNHKPYYMPAWPKFRLGEGQTAGKDFYHLEQSASLNLQTQEGTIYVDQHGNQFLSVPAA
jgi:serine/threonine protein kinase